MYDMLDRLATNEIEQTPKEDRVQFCNDCFLNVAITATNQCLHCFLEDASNCLVEIVVCNTEQFKE